MAARQCRGRLDIAVTLTHVDRGRRLDACERVVQTCGEHAAYARTSHLRVVLHGVVVFDEHLGRSARPRPALGRRGRGHDG